MKKNPILNQIGEQLKVEDVPAKESPNELECCENFEAEFNDKVRNFKIFIFKIYTF